MRATRELTIRAVAAVAATALSLLFGEFALRFFVVASPASAGRLMGVELPPVRVLSRSGSPAFLNASSPVPGMVADGVQLVRGDLWGHFRLDRETGYTHAENVTSLNRWWQSNNLGARSRVDTSPVVPPGRTRVLIFGESYAQGSRLRQEDAWPAILQELDDRVEVVNLAVDGYSMAQALLRYRQLRTQIEYDVVLLTFVPEADPIRDVNTMRQLIDPAWDAPLVPRYRPQAGTLMLVPPLYEDPLDLRRRNADRLSPELREYLRKNDRLYFPSKYEPAPVLGQSIWVKLLAAARSAARQRDLHAELMTPAGEALQVSRAIFEAMERETSADGASFALVILPIEHHWSSGSTSEQLERWSTMAAAVCGGRMMCVDLLPMLQQAPASEVDRTFDEWHFGPKMNRRIATSLKRQVIDALVN